MTDLHVHTDYCDGDDAPEAIVLAAIEKHMECIGFSGHSYTFFDESYCMSKEKCIAYRNEINALKQKYSGQIKILCGIEQDMYSAESTDKYDFVIGSVHYIKLGEAYVPVDENEGITLDTVKKYFGGDFIAYAEKYFDTVKDVAEKTKCNIIGHFDIVTKFNEGNKMFDTGDKRYIAAWQNAVDTLLEYNRPFEINTGAVSRGYRTFPYPAEDIIKYIKAHGGKLLLSSDSHSRNTLCSHFDKFGYLL